MNIKQFCTYDLSTVNKKTLFIIIMNLMYAQIPSGYYDNASGLDDDALKSALHAIISDHTKKSYAQAWDILKESDEDPDNSNNLILLYTGRSQEKDYRDHGASWDYTQYDDGNGTYGNSWNREHVWAKSHGFPSESDTAYTDCHHLRPADRSVNTSRSNKDFDNGGSAHSEATECNYDSDSWEPRDNVKGDIARMIFYMEVRYDPGYHSDDSEYDLEMVDYADSSPAGEPYHGVQSTLYSWHVADEVSTFETNRNDVIYSYQGNRNPFIDHPEYANYLWGGESPTTNPEPSNHVTSFSIGREITITWTDAVTGSQAPDGYLIKMSSSSYSSISDPVDGTFESTSNTKKYVSYGVQTATMSPLSGSSTYYIKIFPYTNSGANIDYKTDSPEQVTITLN